MNIRLASGLAIAAVASAAVLASCGSSQNAGILGRIVSSPNPLDLGGLGSNFAGSVVATDEGYSGTVSVATTCTSGAKPVASLVAPTFGGSPLTVTVTPLNAGSCTLTFSDSNGLTHTNVVNVTTGGIGITSRSRT